MNSNSRLFISKQQKIVYINSTLLFTKFAKASPLSILLANKAKSIN